MAAIIVFLLALAIGAVICGIVWISQIITGIKEARKIGGAKAIIIPIVGVLTLAGIIGLTIVCFR